MACETSPVSSDSLIRDVSEDELFDEQEMEGSEEGRQRPKCQVPGCAEDLTFAKPYFKRRSVCSTHMKVLSLFLNGSNQRFCQQCGKFESVDEFEGALRSCRRALLRRLNNAQISASKGASVRGIARVALRTAGSKESPAHATSDLVASCEELDSHDDLAALAATAVASIKAEVARLQRQEEQEHIQTEPAAEHAAVMKEEERPLPTAPACPMRKRPRKPQRVATSEASPPPPAAPSKATTPGKGGSGGPSSTSAAVAAAPAAKKAPAPVAAAAAAAAAAPGCTEQGEGKRVRKPAESKQSVAVQQSAVLAKQKQQAAARAAANQMHKAQRQQEQEQTQAQQQQQQQLVHQHEDEPGVGQQSDPSSYSYRLKRERETDEDGSNMAGRYLRMRLGDESHLEQPVSISMRHASGLQHQQGQQAQAMLTHAHLVNAGLLPASLATQQFARGGAAGAEGSRLGLSLPADLLDRIAGGGSNVVPLQALQQHLPAGIAEQLLLQQLQQQQQQQRQAAAAAAAVAAQQQQQQQQVLQYNPQTGQLTLRLVPSQTNAAAAAVAASAALAGGVPPGAMLVLNNDGTMSAQAGHHGTGPGLMLLKQQQQQQLQHPAGALGQLDQLRLLAALQQQQQQQQQQLAQGMGQGIMLPAGAAASLLGHRLAAGHQLLAGGGGGGIPQIVLNR